MSKTEDLRTLDKVLGKKMLTGFGKEVHRFEWKHGYRFNTKRMVPPSEAKRLKNLTKFDEYVIKN